MTERLSARLEATALMRQVETTGGFTTILKRGDPDRGALVLLVAERGVPLALIERRMGPDFTYRWTVVEEEAPFSAEKFLKMAEQRTRFDPDLWLIELDVPDAQRFIAETLASS